MNMQDIEEYVDRTTSQILCTDHSPAEWETPRLFQAHDTGPGLYEYRLEFPCGRVIRKTMNIVGLSANDPFFTCLETGDVPSMAAIIAYEADSSMS